MSVREKKRPKTPTEQIDEEVHHRCREKVTTEAGRSSPEAGRWMRSHILCILEMASLSLKTILPTNMIVAMLPSCVKKIIYVHVHNLQQLYGELMDYSVVVAATTDFFLRWSSSPFNNSLFSQLHLVPSLHLNTDSFSQISLVILYSYFLFIKHLL